MSHIMVLKYAPIGNPQFTGSGFSEQYNYFLAQLQQNETMMSQGLNYYANSQLPRSDEVVQQFNLFGSQLNAQLTESNDCSQQYNPYSMSQFDQSLSNDFVNSNSLPAVPNQPPAGRDYFCHGNPQPTAAGILAQQNNPFILLWNESEGQQLPDSLPNPQLAGAGSTNHQYDPPRAQLQENEPIETGHLVNRHGEHLSDYLRDDQSEALKLVDSDSDNILYGEELQKAFDSDG
jgi:hypothetical protein